MAPLPSHSSLPPQSPVWHVPAPDSSNEQPVLAHILPDHPGVLGILTLCPESNLNPVVGRGGVPAPARVPGHIGCGQLFVRVNVQESEGEDKRHDEAMRKNALEKNLLVLVCILWGRCPGNSPFASFLFPKANNNVERGGTYPMEC